MAGSAAISILAASTSSQVLAGAASVGGSIDTKAQLTVALKAASKLTTLPSQLVVPLSGAGVDYPDWTINHFCFLNNLDIHPVQDRPSDATCSFGDTKSSTVLALLGDSQANLWLPTFDAMGKQDHVRIVFYALASCQMASIDTWNNWGLGPSQGCSAFRAWAMSQISILRPKYTVLAFYADDDHFTFDHTLIARADYGAALVQTLRTLKLSSNNVMMLGRIPLPRNDPKVCVAIHPTNLQGCSTPRAAAVTAATEAMLKSTSKTAKVGYFDLMHYGCTAAVCPPVINGTIAYVDLYHYSMHYLAEIQKLVISELHAAKIQ